MIIGRIQNAAAQPYYAGLKSHGPFVPFPVGSGVLPSLLLRGKVLAGPVHAMDFVRLVDAGVCPLADFGLFLNPYVVNSIDTSGAAGARAALLHAPYVLLARRPIEQHSSLLVGLGEGITGSAAEAVVLARVLLAFHWEIPVKMHAELAMEDDAWLLPGGPYLAANFRHFFGYPYAYDLAWEWYRWQKTPFIFYRWVCAPDLEESLRDELVVTIRRALENNLRNLPILATHEAGAKSLERSDVLSYLQAFGYRLGLWEKPAQASLLRLVSLLKDQELQPHSR